MSAPLRTAALTERDKQHLADVFREGGVYCVQDLPLSAQAYLAWSLWHAFGRPLVWVLDGPRHLDLFYQDLAALLQGHDVHTALYPALESLPGRGGAPNLELAGERLQTLQQCMAEPPPGILATSVQALLQKTWSPRTLSLTSMELVVGQSLEMTTLTEYLDRAGYEFTTEVQARGQAAARGGICDCWPPSEAWPVRTEFFGPVIDSVRSFDPVEQRSIEKRSRVNLSPATHAGDDAHAGLADYLRADVCWVWSDPGSIRDHAERYRDSITDDEVRAETPTYRTMRKRLADQFKGPSLSIGSDGPRPAPMYELDLHPCEALPSMRGDLLDPDVLESARQDYLAGVQEKAASGWAVHLFFATDGTRERFQELYGKRLDLAGGLHPCVGLLTEGFFSSGARLMVVAESDLYGLRKDRRSLAEGARRRRGASRLAGQRIAEWTDIQPGDFVVHIDNGIGKYLGLYEINFAGREQEVMAIAYADEAKLYVPVSQAHLLTRYVGVGKQRPVLHRLGGRKWHRDRAVAERAIRDLAASLLETQAARSTEDGLAFPADTPWQHEFEASFPHQETPDQERALQEIKADMESRRPMDRLVCGDVGYGKTEVAMRAAFKAVCHGKQVAVLVPTTVLAQQHFDTFTSRMGPFPITVEVLSRFQTRAEQRRTLERVVVKQTDIVIGTHRLLQPDVQFKDLGLLIIDEEQRFGVEQKEHLKHLRTTVDVLTLTATPIPRTLYMSLTGARDMSTIQTAPQERLPIDTIVVENRDELVRDAILRELNRDGQVFFLHNRVKTINRVKQRLERTVPEARTVVAHGQLPERELADVMHRFIAGEFDVLLCTTIIESGVDIPNVNTILIDRADRFGLSDLYQLRGRVGRYKHQAYAYLLLPRHGRLFDTARKRIGAIRRYSSLGAGFKLALRDLEIRGAGNLLGSEQSGHIAAVGFDLYCQLLKRSVARMKGEHVAPLVDVELNFDFINLATGAVSDEGSAVIPVDYVEDENLRVHAYRKIASAVSEKEVDALRGEFCDRFGPLPSPLDRLLEIATIRVMAAARDIQHIETRGEKVMMMRNGEYLMKNRRFPRALKVNPGEKLMEIIQILRAHPTP